MAEATLAPLLREVRACRVCAEALDAGCRPVLRARATARLLIVGQAPGTRVHASGIPWNDPSGERLRAWMALDPARFYDQARVAIIPMGFCYPGRAVNGGDLPPRPECAPLWHGRLLNHLPALDLVLLVGGYAQRHYLGDRAARTVTATVAAWRDALPRFLPLPHPSWRTRGWVRRNPWFEAELVPELRRRVAALAGADATSRAVSPVPDDRPSPLGPVPEA
ncbi:MAG: uracil-DNA glycosylase family protein [Alphaproteobacteria bacterium]|mgnify:CR=1 FL=1|jgi:uracil-DNA glycosylase|nr:uracil-DNA glycosylase family protein [Alphaproteobacteria bacterium]MDP6516139.1 uracil-DNA glycosylase family protein [Alphaproteobacteria bacterium]